MVERGWQAGSCIWAVPLSFSHLPQQRERDGRYLGVRRPGVQAWLSLRVQGLDVLTGHPWECMCEEGHICCAPSFEPRLAGQGPHYQLNRCDRKVLIFIRLVLLISSWETEAQRGKITHPR